MGGFLSELADDYKESAERGMRRAARRNGRQAGRDVGNVITGIPTVAISQFTTPVNARIENSLEHDQAFVRGTASEGRRAGRNAARQQFGSEHDEEPRGRRSSRDDLPFAPDGSHPSSSRGDEPVAQDRFIVSDGKFTYQIDNGGVPLTREQQRNIGAALADIQSWGGKDEAGALRFALENGLSPDAIIVGSNGRAKSGVDVETFVKQGMTGGDQKNALAILAQAERNPTAFYTPQPQQEFAGNGRSNDGRDADGASSSVQMTTQFQANWGPDYTLRSAPKMSDLSELINAEHVKNANGQEMTAFERVQAIKSVMGQVDERSAAEYNREMGANKDTAANYQNLMVAAASSRGATANDMQSALIATIEADQNAKRFDPAGHEKAGVKLTQGLQNNSRAVASLSSMAALPSTEDLSKVSIGDPDLEKKFRDAVNQQKSWDDMAKGNPIAGMLMMLLRPLIQAMNPDADPMRVLAEASEKGVPINAPEEVKGKLAEALGGRANIQAVAGTPAAAAEQTTSPEHTGAAPAPDPTQVVGAPSPEEAKRGAAAVEEFAARESAGKPPSALSSDNGEERDTAPTLAERQGAVDLQALATKETLTTAEALERGQNLHQDALEQGQNMGKEALERGQNLHQDALEQGRTGMNAALAHGQAGNPPAVSNDPLAALTQGLDFGGQKFTVASTTGGPGDLCPPATNMVEMAKDNCRTM